MSKRESGDIQILGNNINNYWKGYNLFSKIDFGFVYQEDVLWSNMTLDENLFFVGKLKGMSKHDIKIRMSFLKKLLNLELYSKKKPYQLSGGNKRKLCCAMALLSPPKILFLDEFSNGMDPIARKNLYSYLNSLDETSVLLISHRIDEVEKICD